MKDEKFCPICNGYSRKEMLNGRPVMVCERCNLAVLPWKEMSDDEFMSRYNKRNTGEESYTTSLESFVRKETCAELLKVLKDYQPCTREEILRRRGWLSSYIERNLNEALDLELIRFVDSSGVREYMLTELGRDVVKEVVT